MGVQQQQRRFVGGLKRPNNSLKSSAGYSERRASERGRRKRALWVPPPFRGLHPFNFGRREGKQRKKRRWNAHRRRRRSCCSALILYPSPPLLAPGQGEEVERSGPVVDPPHRGCGSDDSISRANHRKKRASYTSPLKWVSASYFGVVCNRIRIQKNPRAARCVYLHEYNKKKKTAFILIPPPPSPHFSFQLFLYTNGSFRLKEMKIPGDR